MPTYDLEILIRTSKSGTGLQDTEKQVKGFTDQIKAAQGSALRFGAALGAVAVAAKLGYDALKRGAELEYVEQKFDRLSDSIGVTSESLERQLKEATRGTRSEMELMASAADLMGLGLAKNQDELIRLTRVSGALNMNMNQLVLTLTNQTTARFDQLGVSVDGFKEKVADLEAQGYDTNAAFKEAFLQQAEAQIDRVGDSADTTLGKLQKLEAGVSNLKSGFELWLADALLPSIDALNTLMHVAQDAPDVIDGIVDANIAEAESVKDLIVQYEKLNAQRGIATIVTGTGDEIADNMEKVRNAIYEASGSADEYAEAIAALGIPGIEANRITEEMTQALYDAAIAEYEATKREKERQRQYELGNRATARADELMLRLAGTYGKADDATEGLALTVRDMNYHQEEAYETTINATDALEEHRKRVAATDEAYDLHRESLRLTAIEQRALATAMGDYFTTAVNDGTDALVSFNRSFTTTGGLTDEQAVNLGELTSAYERTQGNIRSLQGGTAGLGLTEDELNKKLEEQYNALGLIESAMGPLQGITAEVTGVTESLAFNQDAVNSALYAAADAAGANSTALALMKLATGEMSEEQVQAALTSAALNAEILRQGENIANAKDPAAAVAGAMASIQALEQELLANPVQVPIVFEDRQNKASDKIDKDLTPKVDALKGSIVNVASEFINMQTTATAELATVAEAVIDPYDRFVEFGNTVGTLKDNLFGLPEDIYIRIHYETTGTPPTGGGRSDGGDTPAGSYATGGIVPGGWRQPVLIEAHGGEQVIDTSRGGGAAGKSIVIENLNVNVGGGFSRSASRQIAANIAEELGRL